MNKQFKRVGASLALVPFAVGSAMAAVPAEVTTALGDMKTDALAVGGLVLVAVIALAALKFIRRGVSG